MYGDV